MPKRPQFENAMLLAALRDMPREAFRERLRAELVEKGKSKMTDSVAAYLTVQGAAKAIDFYKRVFDAKEILRLANPDGSLGHAEISIGDSHFYLADVPGTAAGGSSAVSSMLMHLYTANVDETTSRAVAAGAQITRPVADQFYGDRSGEILDPFGCKWLISTRREAMDGPEMQRRYDALTRPWLRPGFLNVTPFLVAEKGLELLEFIEQAFGAIETFRDVSTSGMHAEVSIDGCMLAVGSFGAGGPTHPAALHLHVPDVDATYQRALELGATSISAPIDQPYGERGAGIRDLAGNVWYLATVKGPHYGWPELPTLQPYFHAHGADKLMDFLQTAFGGQDIGKHVGPDGTIAHATMRIGTATVELSEAHGPYQPMATTLYLYVENTDATYQRALDAGATSVSAPVDQAYGDRNGVVADPFGNTWYIATRISK